MTKEFFTQFTAAPRHLGGSMIHNIHYEVSENTSDVVTLESIEEIIQENAWIRTKPRITYLYLAYSISPRDAMEALYGCLRLLPPRDLACA